MSFSKNNSKTHVFSCKTINIYSMTTDSQFAVLANTIHPLISHRFILLLTTITPLPSHQPLRNTTRNHTRRRHNSMLLDNNGAVQQKIADPKSWVEFRASRLGKCCISIQFRLFSRRVVYGILFVSPFCIVYHFIY